MAADPSRRIRPIRQLPACSHRPSLCPQQDVKMMGRTQTRTPKITSEQPKRPSWPLNDTCSAPQFGHIFALGGMVPLQTRHLTERRRAIRVLFI